MAPAKAVLSEKQQASLLSTLENRFAGHPERHPRIAWKKVERRVRSEKAKLWSLSEMERTGGEPDVIGPDKAGRQYVFVDCAPESPTGRRSLCFDAKALAARKVAKPKGSAMDLAGSMGVELLSEAEYRHLQTLGEFDTKTSSWVQTPTGVRRLGGALFMDRRYGQVFLYHNGAESYYAARGFRARLLV